MNEGALITGAIPAILILVGIIMAFALVVVWKKKRAGKYQEPVRCRKVLFVVGILLALTGAFLLINGSMLGERTTGIATILGIIGISLIATSSTCMKTQKS